MEHIETKSQVAPEVKIETVQLMNKEYDQCSPTLASNILLAKLVPITIYLSLKLCTNQVLTIFILTVLLVSADFWATKNIFGRKMAGLRWYARTNETNQQRWYFESSKRRVPNTVNVGVFWLSQLVAILFWFIIMFINMVTLSPFWVFLAFFCGLLLTINFAFFTVCKGDHQKTINNVTNRFGKQMFDVKEDQN